MINIYRDNENDEKIVVKDFKNLKNTWINLIDPTDEELDQLAKMLPRVDREEISDALDVDKYSYIDYEGQALYCVIDVPYDRNQDNQCDMTIPLQIIVLKDNVITICKHETLLIQKILNAAYKKGEDRIQTDKQNQFLLLLIQKSIFEYWKELRKLNREVEYISALASDSIQKQYINRLIEIKKTFSYFSTSLKTNQIVQEQLQHFYGKHFAKYKEDIELYEDIIIDNKQALEMSFLFEKLLDNIFDGYKYISETDLNKKITTLTILTVVMQVPNIITGFYGMNIKLPYMDLDLAWAINLLTILAIVFFVWLILQRDVKGKNYNEK